MDTNRSARLALAKATRRSRETVVSVSRVIRTSNPASVSIWCSRSAISSVISFSDTPESEGPRAGLRPLDAPRSAQIVLDGLADESQLRGVQGFHGRWLRPRVAHGSTGSREQEGDHAPAAVTSRERRQDYCGLVRLRSENT